MNRPGRKNCINSNWIRCYWTKRWLLILKSVSWDRWLRKMNSRPLKIALRWLPCLTGWWSRIWMIRRYRCFILNTCCRRIWNKRLCRYWSRWLIWTLPIRRPVWCWLVRRWRRKITSKLSRSANRALKLLRMRWNFIIIWLSLIIRQNREIVYWVFVIEHWNI